MFCSAFEWGWRAVGRCSSRLLSVVVGEGCGTRRRLCAAVSWARTVLGGGGLLGVNISHIVIREAALGPLRYYTRSIVEPPSYLVYTLRSSEPPTTLVSVRVCAGRRAGRGRFSHNDSPSIKATPPPSLHFFGRPHSLRTSVTRALLSIMVCVECLPADRPWDVVSATRRRRRRSSGVASRAEARGARRVTADARVLMADGAADIKISVNQNLLTTSHTTSTSTSTREATSLPHPTSQNIIIAYTYIYRAAHRVTQL